MTKILLCVGTSRIISSNLRSQIGVQPNTSISRTFNSIVKFPSNRILIKLHPKTHQRSMTEFRSCVSVIWFTSSNISSSLRCTLEYNSSSLRSIVTGVFSITCKRWTYLANIRLFVLRPFILSFSLQWYCNLTTDIDVWISETNLKPCKLRFTFKVRLQAMVTDKLAVILLD